ncbi:MAG: glutamate--tRNA ligase family protein, partial [Chloroflexi bacterium]|nr:glutamate--tRNA ligase family protein [Chloroflexota bacterium]
MTADPGTDPYGAGVGDATAEDALLGDATAEDTPLEDAASRGTLLVPLTTSSARPDPRVLPAGPVTRFAPAPTGFLHLGHLVNALYTWGIARATGGRVILRIEDHDRQRSRAAFETALLDDLERLGLVPDEPPVAAFRDGPTPYRQSTAGAAYPAALAQLRAEGLVYACACSRSTFGAYAAERGRPWSGIGCPGGCRTRALPEDDGIGLRVAVGAGSERWVDLLAGPLADEPAASGDLLVRDRAGN